MWFTIMTRTYLECLSFLPNSITPKLVYASVKRQRWFIVLSVKLPAMHPCWFFSNTAKIFKGNTRGKSKIKLSHNKRNWSFTNSLIWGKCVHSGAQKEILHINDYLNGSQFVTGKNWRGRRMTMCMNWSTDHILEFTNTVYEDGMYLCGVIHTYIQQQQLVHCFSI